MAVKIATGGVAGYYI